MKQKLKVITMAVLFVVFALAFSCFAACGNSGNSGNASESGAENVKSLYEMYIEKYPDYGGDEEQFKEDILNGKLGGSGESAKSAYELYKEIHPEYEGTESEWIEEILGLSIGERPQYTVTFKLNETDEEPYATVTVLKGEIPYFPHDTPEKEGYSFVCWGYDGYEWPASYPIAQDTVITAVWETVRYNVTYHLDGGINDVFNPVQYTIEERASLSSPVKDYYSFGGWYSSSSFDDTERVYEIELGSTGDIDLYAKWTPTKYTISYDGVEGATFNGEKIISYDYETDGVKLPKAEKLYYEFLGWTSSEITSPTKDVVINGGSHGNVTYTAKWKPIEYTVTYDLDGGINNEGNIISYTADDFNGEPITLLAPSKDNTENIKNSEVDHLTGMWEITSSFSTYKFDHWEDESGSRVDAIKLGDGDVKIYAKWTTEESAEKTYESLYLRDYENDLLYMGLFPQGEITEENNSELVSALNEILSDGDMASVESDKATGIKQKDIVYNNKKYRKAHAYNNMTGSWFFKWYVFEPIPWSIVNISDDGVALLSCKTSVGCMGYGGYGYWAQSRVRAYLNSTEYGGYDFTGIGVYDQIFNEGQKALIQVSSLDNKSRANDADKESGPNTEDKLFVFSYYEFYNYGLFQNDKGTFYQNSFCWWAYRRNVDIVTLSSWAFTRSLLSDTYNKGEKRLIMRRGSANFVIGYDAAVGEEQSAPIVPAMRIKL